MNNISRKHDQLSNCIVSSSSWVCCIFWLSSLCSHKWLHEQNLELQSSWDEVHARLFVSVIFAPEVFLETGLNQSHKNDYQWQLHPEYKSVFATSLKGFTIFVLVAFQKILLYISLVCIEFSENTGCCHPVFFLVLRTNIFKFSWLVISGVFSLRRGATQVSRV